jgi:hypothetical protein
MFSEPPTKKMKYSLEKEVEIFSGNINFFLWNFSIEKKNSILPEEFSQNIEFYEKVVKLNPQGLILFPKDIQNNKKIVSKTGSLLQYASEELKDDLQVVQVAISNDVAAYKHASPRLQSNENIMLQTLNNNQPYWDQLSKDKFKSKKILIHQINHGGILPHDLPNELLKELTEDIEFVKEFISLNGLFLQCVGDSNKSNFNIVMMAVKQNGMSLQFAIDEFKSDPEIVKMAISKNEQAYEYASLSLQEDENIMLYALSIDYTIWGSISQNKYKSKPIIMKRIRPINCNNFNELSDEIQMNPKFVEKFVSLNGLHLIKLWIPSFNRILIL